MILSTQHQSRTTSATSSPSLDLHTILTQSSCYTFSSLSSLQMHTQCTVGLWLGQTQPRNLFSPFQFNALESSSYEMGRRLWMGGFVLAQRKQTEKSPVGTSHVWWGGRKKGRPGPVVVVLAWPRPVCLFPHPLYGWSFFFTFFNYPPSAILYYIQTFIFNSSNPFTS